LAYNRAKLFSGKALSFDGVNDKVDCGTLDITAYTGISIAMYLNADTVTSVCIPLSLRHSGGDDIRLVAELNGFTYAIDDGTLYQFATPINANEWYYTVLTFDGSTLKGYLNGQEVGSMSASFDFSTADGQLIIGERFSGTFDYDGQLSNVKIFNTALTAAQVADLYNNPEKVVPTGVDNTALKLWLPMQEGAGTTAYDGSGNGNHGTISGATYVHGIGAPVAQTAVIDWNKGVNLLLNSIGANKFVNSWAKSNTTINGDVTDPVGGTDAIEVTMNNSGLLYHTITAFTNGTGSIYMRSDTDGVQVQIGDPTGSPYETKTLTNEWARYDYSDASSIGGLAIYNSVEGGTITIELAFPQVNAGATATPFIPTLSTAQTSPVLLPQGLTTGRDITGVNLFENVRKQGALNLDGNSWAEVHDNESLDVTTGLTLEAWIKLEDTTQAIFGKWNYGGNKREYYMYYTSSSNLLQILFGHGSSAQSAAISYTGDGSWVHFVGTTDGSTITPYLNGVAGTTAVQTTALAASDINVRIGTDDGGYEKSTNQIAQPRIYNRALTAEEVARNYNNAKSIYTNS